MRKNKGLTDVIELHDNVGANSMLYGDTLLRLLQLKIGEPGLNGEHTPSA
jgi:hypothetical protein